MRLLCTMPSSFAALEAGIYKNFYSILSTLTSQEYSDIIPLRSCYEAECWWMDKKKEKRIRSKPNRQGPRRQTKYEKLCQEAEQGFTINVRDFQSGDQNPDKVGKILGE